MLGMSGAWLQGIANTINARIATINQQGTNTQMTALTGTNGMSFYNTTYQSWYDWINNRWFLRGIPDPRYGFVMFDDFTGVDRIGWLDWQNNAGTLSSNQGNPLNPGIYQLRTSTSLCNIRSATNFALLGQADYFIETLVQFTTVPTASDDGVFAWGFHDNATTNDIHAACTDGVIITLDRALNASSLVCATYSNSASSVILTTSVITCGSTFYRLGINVSSINSSATFFLNGVNIATINTNIPNGPGRFTGLQWYSIKTAGGGNLDMQVDSFYGSVLFPTPRAT